MSKTLTQRSPATTVFLHSMWVLLLIVSTLTGFRIRSDDPNSLLALISVILPQGDVWFWHIISGVVLIGLFFSYLWFYRLRRKRFIPKNKQLSARPAHTLSYSLLLLLVLNSLVTGILHLADVNSNAINTLHRLSAYGYGVFIVLHLLAHAKQAGIKALLRIIRPTRSIKFLASSATVCILIIALFAIWVFNNSTTLNAVYTQELITVDGRANEKSWQNAPSVSVVTEHGANLYEGQSKVTIKALYDKANIYFHITWQDPTRSQKHLPLLKTKQGWQIQQSGFVKADENQFYEDKFAILLANADMFANVKSIHLGKQPLTDKPEPLNSRGFHYTTNNKIYDLWHWQSVRSNMHYQADDSHFGPPLVVAKSFPRTFEERKDGTYGRYTAGYQKDPPNGSDWSGISMNWETYKGAFTQPRRLPIEEDDLKSLKDISLNTDISDEGNWWLTWDDTKPYSPIDDNYPIGTLLPSVLITSQRMGDRGNIEAYGYWKEGCWHLEMKRALNTNSPYDVALNNQTYLWFAVFDHTQTRHSRHMRPLRLNLNPKG